MKSQIMKPCHCLGFIVFILFSSLLCEETIEQLVYDEPNYSLLTPYISLEEPMQQRNCDSGSCGIEELQGAKWKNGVPCSLKGDWRMFLCIPFVIDETLNKPHIKVEIFRAMSWFREKTCIAWVFKDKQTDYVRLKDGEGCTSDFVGQKPDGGEQNVTLNKICYKWAATVFHELMHVLGFEHMHQRPDRDEYIDINMTNVRPEGVSNFAIKPNNTGLVTGQSFDYDSLMLYGSMDFQNSPVKGCNNSACYTITKKGGGYLKTVFAKSNPSEEDINVLNTYYGCDSTKSLEVESPVAPVPVEAAKVPIAPPPSGKTPSKVPYDPHPEQFQVLTSASETPPNVTTSEPPKPSGQMKTNAPQVTSKVPPEMTTHAPQMALKVKTNVPKHQTHDMGNFIEKWIPQGHNLSDAFVNEFGA